MRRGLSASRWVQAAALAVLGFVWVTDVLALDPSRSLSQYSLDNWQTAQGLPQNSVEAIWQTHDGYLWLATQEGFVRFDGVRFTVFDRGNTAELGSNHVQAMIQADDGSLWIGAMNGGLTRLKDGRFTRYTGRDGLAGDTVTALAEDSARNLWIATTAGLTVMSGGRFRTYTARDGLPGDAVTSLYADARSDLWIGTQSGLGRYRAGTFETYTTHHGLAGNRVTAVLGDRNGNLWVGTTDGLSRLREGVFTTFRTANGLANDYVRSLHVDRRGIVWVGTLGGLSRLEGSTFSSLTGADGLSSGIITAVREDREGSLWVGTDGGGLNRLRDGKFVTYTTRHGLSSNVAYSLYGDPSGGVWVGTSNGEVNHFKDGSFTVLPLQGKLDGSQVRALLHDSRDQLWIGTDRRLYRYGVSTGRVDSYSASQSLPDRPVRALYEDRKGTILVGTDGGGVCALSGARFVCFTTRDGLASDQVRVIAQDQQGDLWIGTYGGLSRLRNGVFTNYTVADGLSSNFVRSLYEDREGTLWIGTYGGGLNRLKDGRLTAYTQRQGLFSDVVYQILEDDVGNLWMSCNKGVFRVSKQDLGNVADGKAVAVRSVAYSEADGMGSRECNGGSLAGWRCLNAKFWFPTVKGVAVVDPHSFTTNGEPPPVVIERVVVDGRPVDPGKPIILPAGTEGVYFQYTGLSLLLAADTQFMYKLVGFDRTWVSAGTQRTAHYTHLPPGRYTFRVAALTQEGATATAGASADLTMRPFFYQTKAFYAVVGLVVLLTGWGGFRLRVQRLRKEKERLQAKVDEALAEIKVLGGLLPICASCKKVRDDRGYWEQIEVYVHDHSEAQFSHSICPDCTERLYPDLARDEVATASPGSD